MLLPATAQHNKLDLDEHLIGQLEIDLGNWAIPSSYKFEKVRCIFGGLCSVDKHRLADES